MYYAEPRRSPRPLWNANWPQGSTSTQVTALIGWDNVGPLATYPGDDTWTDRPFADGVVLIGDAAGYNSPIIGEGLSIALRDARYVRDALRSGEALPGAFVPYAQERLERMRRLRTAATFMATTFVDDCANRPARRAKFFEMMQTEPLMLAMMGGMMGGPENAPPEAFDGRLQRAMLAA